VGQLARGRHHELGIGADRAREVRHPVDLVTGTETGDPDAGLLDDPGDVPAEHERRGPEQRPRPDRIEVSTGLTPTAWTRTSTSVGKASGRSISAMPRTSGPPKVC
jgi:hypothetical protein